MTTIPDSIIEAVGPVVESVAADMSRRYRRYGLDQADGSQQGWLFVYQHPAQMLRWFDEDNYSPAVACKILARSLRNELENYGQDLKAQAVGYSRDDLAWYDKAMVRALLPAMFDPEAWLDGGLPANGDEDEDEANTKRARRKTVLLSEGNNWIATLADLSQAYAKLGKDDRDILAAFHRDSWQNNMLAEVYGISKQTMSDRHDRAVKRLVDLLGGPKPAWPHDGSCEHPFNGWVGRRAVSNAAARAAQDSYWDEDN